MSVIVCGDKEFNCAERTLIMGVINVTPDSFSDGGLSFSSDKALRNALRLFEEGADIVDVGGVATSPMRSPVDEEEELRRVLPVIAALVKEGHRAISIDTSSASVAKKALDLGASWINDQHAALLDPHMVEVMKKADGVVLMHNVGLPGVHAGENILYDDVINEITVFFRE
ncbi:MAG TPA: dihydropteroate synthase, partial [Myxococcota bacterium]|nr:dihydropteroate synthase [Myxococcota bacterium]